MTGGGILALQLDASAGIGAPLQFRFVEAACAFRVVLESRRQGYSADVDGGISAWKIEIGAGILKRITKKACSPPEVFRSYLFHVKCRYISPTPPRDFPTTPLQQTKAVLRRQDGKSTGLVEPSEAKLLVSGCMSARPMLTVAGFWLSTSMLPQSCCSRQARLWLLSGLQAILANFEPRTWCFNELN